MEETWSNLTNPENEFHERRRNTIGSSDIPIIMGLSPYQTPVDLYRSKLSISPRAPQNFAQRRGTEMEPIARAWFNSRMMLDFFPKLCVHPDVPQFTANLDGWCEATSQAVEIKFSGKADHGLAKSGQIPPHYQAQVDWQYIVSGASSIFYLSYQENDSVIIEAKRPSEARSTELIQAAAAFLEMIRLRVEPPLSKDDFLTVSQDEHLALAIKYRELIQEIKAKEELAEKIRFDIIAAAKGLRHDRVDFGQCLVTRSVKRGAVDYAKLPGIQNVDLDAYRKPDTEIYTVKIK